MHLATSHSSPPANRSQRITIVRYHATGEAHDWLMSAANTDTTNIQLRGLGEQVRDTVQVLLALDQAGWHNPRGLRVAGNITLLPPPSYSPELNPVEMIRRYPRQHCLSNRPCGNHDAFFEAGGKAWNTSADQPDRIQSVRSMPTQHGSPS